MLDRLLQPWLIYTELALSALVTLAGVGMHFWGEGPYSPQAGTFVIWMGLALLALFAVLWLVMVHRRRTTPPAPPAPEKPPGLAGRSVDPHRRRRLTMGSVGLVLALAVVCLPSILGLPDDQWWPSKMIQIAGYALTGASVGVLTQGSMWQQKSLARAEGRAEVTAAANGTVTTTDVASSALIRLDRRRRPSMQFGPLWWWLVGLVVSSATEIVVIMTLQRTGNSAWRVGAFVFAALIVVIVVGFLVAIRRRGQRYLVELKTRGLRHGEPAPETS